MPCPCCKEPLGLNLQFIIKNPVSVCPKCGVVLDFSVNDEVRSKFNEAITEINKIKSRYKKIAKFG